jgi:23S rRNA (cytidine1920-2'-O)/16S rRNA (cytidine1409-2'-O)-methyltransferase
VGSGGIVRDPATHLRVQRELWDFFQAGALKPLALCESPILGGAGNKEFLMHLRLEPGKLGA